MLTYHQIRDVVERSLEQHGPDARALAGAVANLVPSDHREVAYEGVYDKLRTAMWPPRCACELATIAWLALPVEVRSVDTKNHVTRQTIVREGGASGEADRAGGE